MLFLNIIFVGATEENGAIRKEMASKGKKIAAKKLKITAKNN